MLYSCVLGLFTWCWAHLLASHYYLAHLLTQWCLENVCLVSEILFGHSPYSSLYNKHYIGDSEWVNEWMISNIVSVCVLGGVSICVCLNIYLQNCMFVCVCVCVCVCEHLFIHSMKVHPSIMWAWRPIEAHVIPNQLLGSSLALHWSSLEVIFQPSDILCAAWGNNRSCSHQICCVINVTWSFAAHIIGALFHSLLPQYEHVAHTHTHALQ